jgi:hypothetical protein
MWFDSTDLRFFLPSSSAAASDDDEEEDDKEEDEEEEDSFATSPTSLSASIPSASESINDAKDMAPQACERWRRQAPKAHRE